MRSTDGNEGSGEVNPDPGGIVIARKAMGMLASMALGALLISVRQDLIRYVKIKQMSYGNGHPENVPARGRAAYPHPGQETHAGRHGRSQRPFGLTTARDRTGADPQEPIDEGSPDLQTRS
jgi:hypothetical protein